jgi:hypothetical protein
VSVRGIAIVAGALTLIGAVAIGCRVYDDVSPAAGAATSVTEPARGTAPMPARPATTSRMEHTDSSPAKVVKQAADAAEHPALTDEQAMRARASMGEINRVLYADLSAELDLSTDEEEAVQRLLLEFQMQTLSLDAVQSISDAATYRDLKQRLETDVEALLGATRAMQFVEFQRSIDVRHQVADMDRELRDGDLPLSDEQRKAMTRAAIAGGAFVTDRELSGGESQEAYSQELMAHLMLRDQRLVEVAREILNPNQFQRYRAYIEGRSAAYIPVAPDPALVIR